MFNMTISHSFTLKCWHLRSSCISWSRSTGPTQLRLEISLLVRSAYPGERESGCWLKRRALPFLTLRLPPAQLQNFKVNSSRSGGAERELSDSTTCRIEKGWRQPGSCPIVDSIFPPISSPASLHRNPQDTKCSTTLNSRAEHCITHWASPTAYTHTQRDSCEFILKTEYIVCCRKEESTVWWVAMISWWDITEISWRRRSRYREDPPVADSAARLRAGVGRREKFSAASCGKTHDICQKFRRPDFQDNNSIY